jgi:hypothetical protein
MIWQSVDVWMQDGSRRRRYRCLKLLGQDRYVVVSVDFVSSADSPGTRQFQVRCFQEQLECVGDLPSAPSLEEAIRRHDATFESSPS